MRFKNGDRVRALVNWCQVKKDDKYVVTEVVRDKGVWVDVKGWSNHYMTNSEIELVEDNWDHDPRKAAKTEPLKIEAGKFYKTRDGRKVGPMKMWDASVEHSWESLGADPDPWRPDGTSDYTANLIAEWTSSCAAAQVDNLRDEYGPVVKASTGAAGNDNDLTLGDILSEALRKPKFKVGDRVIHKSEVANGIFDPGVVTSIEDGEVKVDWQKYSSGWTISVGSAAAFLDHLEQNTPTIVCLIENGQPKPSTEPHVHANKEAASKEATRLARKHPGQEFGVYELVSTVQEAKPTYQHEWQRLAVGGERIPAIKAYREAGGRRQTFVTSSYGSPGYEDRHVIGLKEAKDAVEHWLATAA